MNFTEMAEIARSINEKNDCAVKALAMAAGISYSDAHTLLRKHGRKHGKRTKWHSLWNALGSLEMKWEQVLNIRYKTIRTWGYHRPKGIFLIATSGHLLCSRDGIVEDWTDGRCHRITHVWRILPTEEKEKHTNPEVPRGKPRRLKRLGEPSSKFTICSLWRIAPEKTLQDAAQLAEEYGVQFSTVKGWIGEWSRGKNFPTR